MKLNSRDRKHIVVWYVMLSYTCTPYTNKGCIYRGNNNNNKDFY